MALLTVLLCRSNRRASRDELVEAIWPDHGKINAAHALESAASVLRRHILRTGEMGSLLLTLHSGGEKNFKLAGRQRIGGDDHVFLLPLFYAMTAELQGQKTPPLPKQGQRLHRCRP